MARRKRARPPRANPGLRTWLILIGAAGNRQTLRDGDVAERAGIRSARAVARTLGRISALCRAYGLPALDSLVVNARTGRAHSDASDTDAGAAREAVFDFDWYAVRPPSNEELNAAEEAAREEGSRPRARGGSRSRARRQPTRPRRIKAHVHDANEIPKGERTRNVGDDEAAAEELAPKPRTRGGPVGASPPTAAAPAWRVAKCLLALRDQVNQRTPNRKKLSDGTIGDVAHAARTSDHNPWVRDGAVGVVTAMDITHDPGGGCDAGALAEAIRASRDPRVKYVIWNRRIANSSSIAGAAPWTWRPYDGANPHDKHVHLSVKPEKTAYDLTTTWAI
jgi:hypothetical protein